MRSNLRTTFLMLSVCAMTSFLGSASQAATILKLNLGGTGPDVAMNALGVYSTVDDGNAATTGDQNTDVEFTGFLDGPFADIPTAVASFSIAGVGRVGPPDVGALVTQNFFAGTISLYDAANTLLLAANLQDSALVGTVGMPGVGGFFTVTLGTATAGTLMSYITPGTIGMSMPLTDINGGMGLLVLGNVLQPFDADASANISAEPVPEPTAALFALVASFVSAVMFRRQRG